MLRLRDSLQNKDTHRPRVEGWKKIFHANRDANKAGVVVLSKWALKQRM